MLSRIALILLLVLAAGPTHAGEDEFPWVKSFKSQVRLIPAGVEKIDGKDALMAAVHMKMEPGWKTYWRVPGDAGLPPSFGWSRSDNLKQAHILWPGPERFTDAAGTSIGYHDEVVFPVIIEPGDKGKPVELALDFEFAICKDICAPAEAKLALKVDGNGTAGSGNSALVKRYLAQVPSKERADDSGPSITAMQVKLDGPKPNIVIDAKFPAGGGKTDLFIEGPSDTFIPLAERLNEEAGGAVRYMVDLTKGGDPAALKGKDLSITLISPGQNREVTRRVE